MHFYHKQVIVKFLHAHEVTRMQLLFLRIFLVYTTGTNNLQKFWTISRKVYTGNVRLHWIIYM